MTSLFTVPFRASGAPSMSPSATGTPGASTTRASPPTPWQAASNSTAAHAANPRVPRVPTLIRLRLRSAFRGRFLMLFIALSEHEVQLGAVEGLAAGFGHQARAAQAHGGL